VLDHRGGVVDVVLAQEPRLELAEQAQHVAVAEPAQIGRELAAAAYTRARARG
jgi:hypothetical protein